MTSDLVSPPLRSRGLHPWWLTRLLGVRSTSERRTNVFDMPPRILDDIGISRDLVDVMQRHRR